MKRWKVIRRLLWVLAALLVCCIVAFPLGHFLLRQEVTRQLSAFGEDRIEIASVTLGIRQQKVQGIRLYAAGGSEPWADVATATLDLSLWQVLQGQRTPDRIHVHGGTLAAQLAEDGTLDGVPTDRDLVLSIPADLLTATDLTVRVSQPNRQTLEAHVEQCRLERIGDEFQASGVADDLLDASWELTGTFNPLTGAVAASVQSSTLQIDTDALRKLPLVPDIPLTGAATLNSQIHAQFSQVPGQDVSYNLKLNPQAVNLRLPGLEIPATNGRGTVVVANGQVSIEAFQADVGAGTVTADGAFNVNRASADGKVTVAIRDVQLAELPQDWAELPLDWQAADVQGTLNGEFNLQVEFAQQRLLVLGGGRADLANLEAFGIAVQPVDVNVTLANPLSAESLVGGTVTVTGGVDGVDLRTALRALNMPLANLPPFAGRGSGQGTVVVPLETVTDVTSYQATGNASLSEASLMTIDMLSGSTQFDWHDGKLTMTEIAFQLGQDANVAGSATIPLAANERISAEFTADKLPTSLLSELLPDLPLQVHGDVSGTAKLQVPTDRMTELNAWQATGSVRSDRVTYDQINADNLSTQFAVRDRVVHLSEARGTWRGLVAHADATLTLQAPFGFSANFHSDAIPLTVLAELLELDDIAKIAGTLHGRGSAQGTLMPIQWNASGKVDAEHVAVDRWSLAAGQCEWEADATRLLATVTDLQTLGGSIGLSAKVPLNFQGQEQLTANLSQLSVNQMTELVPLTLPVEFAGEVNGRATLKGFLQPPKAQLDAKLAGFTASSEGLATSPMTCLVAYQNGDASVEVETDVLGSAVQLRGSGKVDVRQRTTSKWNGHCEVQGLQFRQVAKLLKKNRQLKPFQGTADLTLDVQLESPDAAPTGSGQLTVRNVRYQNRVLTSALQANVVLEENRLFIRDMRSNIAGGVARGNMSLRLNPLGTGQFTLNLDRLSSQVLFATEQNLLRKVRGPLSVTLRGQLGPTMYGSGQAIFSNTRLADVRLENVQAPFKWSYRPSTGQGRTQIQLKSARIAQGRVQGNVDLAWGQRIDLTADAQATALDLKQLSRSLPFLDHWLTGKVNGQVHVKGRNIRSLDDLSGNFKATLLDSQTFALPVLESLTSNLGLGSATSESFRTTEAQGSFRRGVLYLDQMTLERPQQRVWIEGQINTRGRLDFNVTADTRQLTAAAVAVGVLRPLDFVRRRLLFFHLGGTVSSPVVQPRTAEFVQQEILLFFVPFAVPTPPAGF